GTPSCASRRRSLRSRSCSARVRPPPSGERVRDALGIALVVAGTAPLTFRAGVHELADHGHKWRTGRRTTNRRRRLVARAIDTTSLALAVLGVAVLAGLRL